MSEEPPAPLSSPTSTSLPSPPLSPIAPLPPRKKVDRYGFFVEDADGDAESFAAGYSAGDPHHPHPSHLHHLSHKQVRLEYLRAKKWLSMLSHWPSWKTRHERRLRRRIRKGIPDALRGRVWMLLSEANVLKDEQPGLYASLLTQTPRAIDLQCIMLDLPRTMPNHYLFSTAGTACTPLSPSSALVADADMPSGQRSLKNVLCAYAVYDQAVGYCQGMAFCASLLLSYMPEEDAFFMLHVLMRSPKYAIAGMYSPGLPMFAEVMHIFGQLVDRVVPRLARRMEELGISHSMYASQWFMTLFTYNLPFDLVTRIWDMFLHEGWKAIYRIALALLKANEKVLLSLDFDGIIDRLKSLPVLMSAEKLVRACLSIRLPRAQIERMHSDYRIEFQHEIRERVDAAIADAERSERIRAAARAQNDAASGTTTTTGSSVSHTSSARAATRQPVTVIVDEDSDNDVEDGMRSPGIAAATHALHERSVTAGAADVACLSDPTTRYVAAVGVTIVAPSLKDPVELIGRSPALLATLSSGVENGEGSPSDAAVSARRHAFETSVLLSPMDADLGLHDEHDEVQHKSKRASVTGIACIVAAAPVTASVPPDKAVTPRAAPSTSVQDVHMSENPSAKMSPNALLFKKQERVYPTNFSVRIRQRGLSDGATKPVVQLVVAAPDDIVDTRDPLVPLSDGAHDRGSFSTASTVSAPENEHAANAREHRREASDSLSKLCVAADT